MPRLFRLSALLLFIATDMVLSRPLSTPIFDNTERAMHTVLFEGDIRLPEGDRPYGNRKRRQAEEPALAEAMADPGYHHRIWPNQTVYYTYDQRLSEYDRSVFAEAIEEWKTHTCLNFIHTPDYEQNHILFVRDNTLGCSSDVGMKGGLQKVSMSDNCFGQGHAIHEIGHAIGLWHEHSRPDRDDYIEVHSENIIPEGANNFGKLTEEKFGLVPDVGYDIESIMHYGPYAFSDAQRKRTITIRDTAPLDYKHCINLLEMGQREKLSYLDKLRANRLYSCTNKIRELEDQGRKCILPATTPTPATTVATTTMPSPTTTLTPIPSPSPPSTRLKSGSVITLRVERPGDQAIRGVVCTPTCKVEQCVPIGDESSCDFLNYQFEIVVRKNPDAKKVRSGDEVALRLMKRPTQWLDCSSADSVCSTTRCTGNDADSITNASVTTCDSHHFKIIGVRRPEGKLLNMNHSIQLKHEFNQSFLNCNDNNKCKLSSEEASFKFQIQQ